MSSWRLLVAAALVAGTHLTMFTACDDDARVLWERDTDTIDDSSSAVTTSGSGGFPELPPPDPPELPVCGQEEEVSDTCLCPAEEACICGLFEEQPDQQACTMICDDGNCELICAGPGECNAECAFGCVMHCDANTSCILGCGGGCNIVCEAGSACMVWSWDGPSEVYCAEGAICICEIEENCICSGPGCSQP